METLKCKACGYLIRSDKLKDVCPACGVSRTAFGPFKETMSKNRKMILELNLHPMMVHFPQALAVMIPPLIISALFMETRISADLLISARILSVLLPFSVLSAAVFGLIDGKTRFKRLTTPLLKKKIITGAVLFVLSCAVAAIAFFMGTDYPARVYLLVLSVACVGCEILLGKMGNTLICAKLPG